MEMFVIESRDSFSSNFKIVKSSNRSENLSNSCEFVRTKHVYNLRALNNCSFFRRFIRMSFF